MKAVRWHGTNDVRVDTVPDSTNLHLYDGYVPTIESSDVLSHESTGEVVEIGREAKEWQ